MVWEGGTWRTWCRRETGLASSTRNWHTDAYTHMHTHACACICMHMHMRMRMRMHMHSCACACTCMHMHVHVHVHAYACVCICMHAYAYACMHIVARVFKCPKDTPFQELWPKTCEGWESEKIPSKEGVERFILQRSSRRIRFSGSREPRSEK